jgi:hypothetical protein
MSGPANNYDIGYGRPPEHHKWKPGECGNPHRIYTPKPKPVVTMIDEFFARQMRVTENCKSRRRSAFEIIYLQLMQKAAAGQKRAVNVWLQYHEFAASRSSTKIIQNRNRRR